MSVVCLKRLDIENTQRLDLSVVSPRTFIWGHYWLEAISTNFVTVDPRYTDQCQNQSRWETEINRMAQKWRNSHRGINILSSLTADDVVVFTGSAPSSLGMPYTNNLIASTRATGAQRDGLAPTLKGKPWLIPLGSIPISQTKQPWWEISLALRWRKFPEVNAMPKKFGQRSTKRHYFYGGWSPCQS